MSAPAANPLADFLPDPTILGEDRPSRFRRLLGAVRTLIDYGKQLAATLQQHATAATTEFTAVTLPFGTTDIGLILARITRALLRANALEARVVELAARPAPPPRPPRPPARRAPRPKSARPIHVSDPRLAGLPTPEEIADEIRRRPLGAIIVDICRDLGIMPGHPLWRELRIVVVRHGGNFGNLFKDIYAPMLPTPRPSPSAAMPAASPAPFPPAPAAIATGPPP